MYDDLDFDFEDDFGLDAEEMKLLDKVLEVLPEVDEKELEDMEAEVGSADVQEYTDESVDHEEVDETETVDAVDAVEEEVVVETIQEPIEESVEVVETKGQLAFQF